MKHRVPTTSGASWRPEASLVASARTNTAIAIAAVDDAAADRMEEIHSICRVASDFGAFGRKHRSPLKDYLPFWRFRDERER